MFVKLCLSHGADTNRNLFGNYETALAMVAEEASVAMAVRYLTTKLENNTVDITPHAAFPGNLLPLRDASPCPLDEDCGPIVVGDYHFVHFNSISHDMHSPSWTGPYWHRMFRERTSCRTVYHLRVTRIAKCLWLSKRIAASGKQGKAKRSCFV